MSHIPVPQPLRLLPLYWLCMSCKAMAKVIATHPGVKRAAPSLLLVAALAMPAWAQDVAPTFPRFRYKDTEAAHPLTPESQKLVLLTDKDFAPWSFVDEKGTPQGIAVDLAVSACAAAKLECTVLPLAFTDLRSTLAGGGGDAIISGLRLEEGMLSDYRFTRPYYLSLGRFVARAGASLSSNDARALTGKRVGFVKNSAHGVFLARHYAKSQLQPFDSLDQALEALRTGALDAVFGDSISVAFWLSGSNSRKCCQILGKSFVDRETFSRELVYLTKPGRENLRDILDAALDELEDKGETARIFTTYLPGPVW